MEIEVIMNGVHYDAIEIDTHDMVTGTGIHYIFEGNSWYQLKRKQEKVSVKDMREVLGAAVAREWISFKTKSMDKIIRDLNDCKYQPEEYIKEWYKKFFTTN